MNAKTIEKLDLKIVELRTDLGKAIVKFTESAQKDSDIPYPVVIKALVFSLADALKLIEQANNDTIDKIVSRR